MAFYSKFCENYAQDITLGLICSAAMIFGGISAFNFFNKTELTTFSEFQNDKKVSISLEDYVGMRGKTTDNYDILQIYKCDQIVPKNTEIIVENLKDKCSGLALIPK